MQRNPRLIALALVILVLSSTMVIAQWRPINIGLYGSEVGTLYAHNGVVYEVGSNGTVYRSLDAANHWETSGVDLANGYAAMASNAKYDIMSYNGVWLTSDQGLTWKPRGLDTISFLSMMVRGDMVFGATHDGLYKSTDQGLHWQQCSNKGKPAQYFLGFTQMGLSVIAVTSDSVYRSTDDGESWTGISTLDVNSVNTVHLIANGDTLLACVNRGYLFVSLDSAKSWYTGNLPATTNALDIHDSLLIAVGTSSLYFSPDFGLSWEKRGNFRRSAGYLTITWIGDTLLVGDFEGVFRSVDHGYTWTSQNQGLDNTEVWSFCTSSNLLYAGTYSNGAFLSLDSGEHWEPVTDTKSFDFGIPCMLSSGDTLFASGQLGGLQMSSNRGQSWHATLGTQGYIRALTQANGVLYYDSGVSGGGMYTSTDQGENWNLHKDVLPDTFSPRDIWAFGDTVVVADDNGPFASFDHGVHWTAINSGIEGIPISSVWAEGKQIWLTSDTLGVLYSSDFGQSWTQMNNGLSNLNRVFIRRNNNILVSIAGYKVIGTFGSAKVQKPAVEVNVSTDNGLHWKNITANLKSTFGYWCAALYGQNIYIGFDGRGVYTAKLSDFDLSLDVSQSDEAIRPTGTFAFHQSLPASFIAPFISTSGLTLVDILGRSKKHWSAQELQACSALDISDLEEGVYSVESAGCRTTILVY